MSSVILDCSDAPDGLPSAAVVHVAPGIVLQPPLSRRCYGPGLIVIVPEATTEKDTQGNPSPLQKWAEESFATVEISCNTLAADLSLDSAVQLASDALQNCDKCDREKGLGVVVYDSSEWNNLVKTFEKHSNIVVAVVYSGITSRDSLVATSIPSTYHLAGKTPTKLPRGDRHMEYEYPGAQSSFFALPGHKTFNYRMESISHTRNLTFMKTYIGGPYFDLEAIWDEHTSFEFENRSVPKTMATMVQEPYVNHIPTITGGIGREDLTAFYSHHFIYSNPKDTELELVSRTIGIDRICDEFLFKFTHDQEIDWLAPGVPPTGRYLRIPFTAVVNVRGDRLYHEHIAWDQGTVLRQLGIMPEYLPFPYALPNGQKPSKGRQFQIRVPVAGDETAEKMLDRHSIPSNEMFKFQIQEVNL